MIPPGLPTPGKLPGEPAELGVPHPLLDLGVLYPVPRLRGAPTCGQGWGVRLEPCGPQNGLDRRKRPVRIGAYVLWQELRLFCRTACVFS